MGFQECYNSKYWFFQEVLLVDLLLFLNSNIQTSIKMWVSRLNISVRIKMSPWTYYSAISSSSSSQCLSRCHKLVPDHFPVEDSRMSCTWSGFHGDTSGNIPSSLSTRSNPLWLTTNGASAWENYTPMILRAQHLSLANSSRCFYIRWKFAC